MIKLSYSVDVISPLFLGGAEPQARAEIRAPSIRGQLRWWFRVLDGFRSLPDTELRAQESEIFGSTAGDEGRAGNLIVRVSGLPPSQDARDDKGMDATIHDAKGYFLFPLRTQKRAVFNAAMTAHQQFHLDTIWRGPANLRSDIEALLAVFLHLGSLGFRGRRAMGALAPSSALPPLQGALAHFNSPQNVLIKQLTDVPSVSAAVDALANWLKSWRAHGRATNNKAEQNFPGFSYAKSDHDAAASRPPDTRTPAYRPALGLPVMTKYGNWGLERPKGPQPAGRFASPVILRPHRLPNSRIAPLVLFIEKLKWCDGTPAYRGPVPIPVSNDLYESMKGDRRLAPFEIRS